MKILNYNKIIKLIQIKSAFGFYALKHSNLVTCESQVLSHFFQDLSL